MKTYVIRVGALLATVVNRQIVLVFHKRVFIGLMPYLIAQHYGFMCTFAVYSKMCFRFYCHSWQLITFGYMPAGHHYLCSHGKVFHPRPNSCIIFASFSFCFIFGFLFFELFFSFFWNFHLTKQQNKKKFKQICVNCRVSSSF